MNKKQTICGIIVILSWFFAAIVIEAYPVAALVAVACMGICVPIGGLQNIDWESMDNDDKLQDTDSPEDEEEQPAARSERKQDDTASLGSV